MNVGRQIVEQLVPTTAKQGITLQQMSRADAMGWRLGRNYLWIYTAVLLAWLAKLDLEQPKGWVLEFPEAFSPADIGNFPGWLVFLGVMVFYTYLIWLAIRAARTYPLEDG